MKTKATYVSVWDGSEIRTECEFDVETNQVSNIKNTDQDIEEFINCEEEFIELPDGYEAQIRPRSGLAIKQGITCLNTPGTIDSDYRGELKVILINLSKEPQVLSHGDRIAQMVISSVDKANLILVDEINSTQRGEGGFGHTGKK